MEGNRGQKRSPSPTPIPGGSSIKEIKIEESDAEQSEPTIIDSDSNDYEELGYDDDNIYDYDGDDDWGYYMSPEYCTSDEYEELYSESESTSEDLSDFDDDNPMETIQKSKHYLPLNSITIILAVMRDDKIKSLSLRGKGIRNKGAKLIAKILKHTGITRLDLRENSIGSGGVKAITTALKDTRITHLDLSETNVDDRGVKFIAEELKNTRLTSLNLGRKKISDEGAEAIANALKNSQIISMEFKGDDVTDTGKLALLMAVSNTQIIDMKIGYGVVANFMKKACQDNSTKMDKIYEELKRFVKKNNEILEFVVDNEDTKPTRYINFTKTILVKRQSYLDYFISKSYEENLIQDFIENIEKRLTEFFSKLAYTCIEHTKLLLRCEREGLSMVVEGLLDHRPNYVLFEDILHPAVCILMNKYGKPWRFENMKPTTDELLKIWNNFDLDDLLMEDQLTDCNCHDFSRKAFVKLLSRNQ